MKNIEIDVPLFPIGTLFVIEPRRLFAFDFIKGYTYLGHDKRKIKEEINEKRLEQYIKNTSLYATKTLNPWVSRYETKVLGWKSKSGE